MELREKVAQAVSHAAGCPEEWADWFNEADAAIAAIGDARLRHEDEAWRVAQLAATLCGGAHAIGRGIDAVGSVRTAAFLLAESRRQAAVSPTTEDGSDGR